MLLLAEGEEREMQFSLINHSITSKRGGFWRWPCHSDSPSHSPMSLMQRSICERWPQSCSPPCKFPDAIKTSELRFTSARLLSSQGRWDRQVVNVGNNKKQKDLERVQKETENRDKVLGGGWRWTGENNVDWPSEGAERFSKSGGNDRDRCPRPMTGRTEQGFEKSPLASK